MLTVFLVQWRKFQRDPFTMLFTMALTLIFIFVFGFNLNSKTSILTYADSSLTSEQRDAWIDKLNRSDRFTFVLTTENRARQQVIEGHTNLAVKLMANNYVIITAIDSSPNQHAISQHLATFYQEEIQLRALEEQTSEPELRKNVEQRLANPDLQMVTSNMKGETGSFHNGHNLQLLFGMTLFFVITTITFATSAILEEKRTQSWNRLILSPIRKWEMYTGHLLYSFLIGNIQILAIFLLFHFAFGINLQPSLGPIIIITACYSFAIAALGVLLTGLVKTTEQFQVLAPNLASIIAMLGGAYWPLEIVTNPILLAIAKLMPINHAMEALKGAVVYNQGILELTTPLAILLLFGVICMGIGINLIERR